MHIREGATLVAILICGFSNIGCEASSYEVPLTEYEHSDFQGSWGVRFGAPLERHESLPLALTPEAARGFRDASPSFLFSGNTDPDIETFGPQQLQEPKPIVLTSTLLNANSLAAAI